MFIRAYADTPLTYVASVGEVVHVRYAGDQPYARAVILKRSRRKGRMIRYEFMWLEEVEGSPAVKGEMWHVYARPDGPPYVKFIDKGAAD